MEQRTMRAMPGDEVERMPVTTREQVEQKLAVVEAKARDLARRHGRLATGIALTAATAFGIGMLLYRRRRNTSMLRRAQRTIPSSVWEMPEELIAQLKKPLQRAAKAI